MNDKDEFELEKLKLVESVRQTVEHELKRRYSWMGFGLAIIMGSLVTLTVDREDVGKVAETINVMRKSLYK